MALVHVAEPREAQMACNLLVHVYLEGHDWLEFGQEEVDDKVSAG